MLKPPCVSPGEAGGRWTAQVVSRQWISATFPGPSPDREWAMSGLNSSSHFFSLKPVAQAFHLKGWSQTAECLSTLALQCWQGQETAKRDQASWTFRGQVFLHTRAPPHLPHPPATPQTFPIAHGCRSLLQLKGSGRSSHCGLPTLEVIKALKYRIWLLPE